MTDKEIEQALKDMALNLNWGSVERMGDTSSDGSSENGPNGVPKNIAVIQETLAYIDRLKAENAKLKEYIVEDRVEELQKYGDIIRKETAKEILQTLYDYIVCDIDVPLAVKILATRDEICSLAEEYEVEVDE